MERTLVLLKPDCIQRRLMGRVLSRFEDKGLDIIAMKLISMTTQLARQHYAEHVEKDWYPRLEAYVMSGPLLATVVEGPSAIDVVRKMVGPTDSLTAEPGTIRGDFGTSHQKNVVHASDGPVSAAREIGIFFEESEIHGHEPTIPPWLCANNTSYPKFLAGVSLRS